jgi:hypothetical protein
MTKIIVRNLIKNSYHGFLFITIQFSQKKQGFLFTTFTNLHFGKVSFYNFTNPPFWEGFFLQLYQSSILRRFPFYNIHKPPFWEGFFLQLYQSSILGRFPFPTSILGGFNENLPFFTFPHYKMQDKTWLMTTTELSSLSLCSTIKRLGFAFCFKIAVDSSSFLFVLSSCFLKILAALMKTRDVWNLRWNTGHAFLHWLY